MNEFLTWEVLKSYATFVSIVFMVVEFTKDLPVIKKMPTKYWSFFIATLLLTILNLVIGTFKSVDIVLYLLSGISISLGANGLSNFNDKRSEIMNEEIIVETEDEQLIEEIEVSEEIEIPKDV